MHQIAALNKNSCSPKLPTFHLFQLLWYCQLPLQWAQFCLCKKKKLKFLQAKHKTLHLTWDKETNHMIVLLPHRGSWNVILMENWDFKRLRTAWCWVTIQNNMPFLIQWLDKSRFNNIHTCHYYMAQNSFWLSRETKCHCCWY